ncbi:MAG: hypothetical protein N2Z60_08705, partial [Elusimicrobiales bacterium]|nr:hypothetical protein [Elusimicrobiales bacterium]
IIGGDTIFGAEESGGYCWKGNIPDRDGLVTSLLFIEMMANYKKNVSDIYKQIESSYGFSNFIREDISTLKVTSSKYSYAMKVKSRLPKTVLNKNIKEIVTIDGIRVILENDWWFLIRPSGTEPLLRIYVETDTEKHSKELMKFAREISII